MKEKEKCRKKKKGRKGENMWNERCGIMWKKVKSNADKQRNGKNAGGKWKRKNEGKRKYRGER